MTKITDPATILDMIGRHEIMVEKTWPGTEEIRNHLTWRKVPRRLMRHLVGAGLVQPHRLGWGGGSWVYRLTELGEVVKHVHELDGIVTELEAQLEGCRQVLRARDEAMANHLKGDQE